MQPERTDHNCDGVFSGNYICSHPAHEPGTVPVLFGEGALPSCETRDASKSVGSRKTGAGTARVPNMQDGGA